MKRHKPKDMIKLLNKYGWTFVGWKGSHIIMTNKEGDHVHIPNKKELTHQMWNIILKKTGLKKRGIKNG